MKNTLLRKAASIRRDVAYDTKWGTNFPKSTIVEPLRRAEELERIASTLEGIASMKERS